MKKLLMLSVLALSFGAMPALADHHEGKKNNIFEKYDANSDGVVTKEEFISHAEKKFAELDADGDGSISKAESDAKKAEWKEKMKERRAKMKEMKEERTGESETEATDAPPAE